MKKTNPKLKAFDGQECEKCEYQWYPRKEKPRQCPNCKRQIKYPSPNQPMDNKDKEKGVVVEQGVNGEALWDSLYGFKGENS